MATKAATKKKAAPAEEPVAQRTRTRAVAKKKTGGALSVFDQRMADLAKEQVSFEAESRIPRISFNKGEFMTGKDESLGEEIECVLVDECFVNEYFLRKYNPEAPEAPDCFAIIQRDEGEMAPHANSKAPQSDNCAVCPQNQFGTADVGRGKACNNKRRVTLISVDKLKGKTIELEEGDLYQMMIPPTSGKSFRDLKKEVKDSVNRPLQAVSIIVRTKRKENYYELKFEMGDLLSEKQFDEVLRIREKSREALMQPYAVKSDEPRKPVGKKPGSKKGPRVTKQTERKTVSSRAGGKNF